MGYESRVNWVVGQRSRLFSGSSDLLSGMSVKAVSLAGEKWYVGSAPRSQNVGQVLMLRDGQRGSGYLRLDEAHVLTGQQFGSGFGYDIAIDDFNLDGSDHVHVSPTYYYSV